MNTARLYPRMPSGSPRRQAASLVRQVQKWVRCWISFSAQRQVALLLIVALVLVPATILLLGRPPQQRTERQATVTALEAASPPIDGNTSTRVPDPAGWDNPLPILQEAELLDSSDQVTQHRDSTPLVADGAPKPPGPPSVTPTHPAAPIFSQIDDLIQEGIAAGAFPGAVVLIGRGDKVLKHTAYGSAVVYGADGQRLAEPTPTRVDTIFDLASVSKLFTAVAVMQLVERGAIDLDAPVQRYLLEFTGPNKGKVRVRHLLTHNSGLPSGPAGPRPLILNGASRMERLRHALQTPLRGIPGQKVVYSDVNFITLGAIIERVTGQRQDTYVSEQILRPLGMADTSYRPGPELRDRIAATTLVPGAAKFRTGPIHGEVHDDDAWSLDGVAGHAGLFSTAADLARFTEMILDGGTYDGVRLLRAETLAEMARISATSPIGEHRGLGFEIDQPWFMGGLAGPRTVGHAGYTGTSLVINLDKRAFAIVLTNRLHPRDQRTNLRVYRSGIGNLAAALTDLTD